MSFQRLSIFRNIKSCNLIHSYTCLHTCNILAHWSFRHFHKPLISIQQVGTLCPHFWLTWNILFYRPLRSRHLINMQKRAIGELRGLGTRLISSIGSFIKICLPENARKKARGLYILCINYIYKNSKMKYFIHTFHFLIMVIMA
jgi:hypothetical protein